jgi:hypothetical protein
LDGGFSLSFPLFRPKVIVVAEVAVGGHTITGELSTRPTPFGISAIGHDQLLTN